MWSQKKYYSTWTRSTNSSSVFGASVKADNPVTIKFIGDTSKDSHVNVTSVGSVALTDDIGNKQLYTTSTTQQVNGKDVTTITAGVEKGAVNIYSSSGNVIQTGGNIYGAEVNVAAKGDIDVRKITAGDSLKLSTEYLANNNATLASEPRTVNIAVQNNYVTGYVAKGNVALGNIGYLASDSVQLTAVGNLTMQTAEKLVSGEYIVLTTTNGSANIKVDNAQVTSTSLSTSSQNSVNVSAYGDIVLEQYFNSKRTSNNLRLGKVYSQTGDVTITVPGTLVDALPYEDNSSIDTDEEILQHYRDMGILSDADTTNSVTMKSKKIEAANFKTEVEQNYTTYTTLQNKVDNGTLTFDEIAYKAYSDANTDYLHKLQEYGTDETKWNDVQKQEISNLQANLATAKNGVAIDLYNTYTTANSQYAAANAQYTTAKTQYTELNNDYQSKLEEYGTDQTNWTQGQIETMNKLQVALIEQFDAMNKLQANLNDAQEASNKAYVAWQTGLDDSLSYGELKSKFAGSVSVADYLSKDATYQGLLTNAKVTDTAIIYALQNSVINNTKVSTTNKDPNIIGKNINIYTGKGTGLLDGETTTYNMGTISEGLVSTNATTKNNAVEQLRGLANADASTVTWNNAYKTNSDGSFVLDANGQKILDLGHSTAVVTKKLPVGVQTLNAEGKLTVGLYSGGHETGADAFIEGRVQKNLTNATIKTENKTINVASVVTDNGDVYIKSAGNIINANRTEAGRLSTNIPAIVGKGLELYAKSGDIGSTLAPLTMNITDRLITIAETGSVYLEQVGAYTNGGASYAANNLLIQSISATGDIFVQADKNILMSDITGTEIQGYIQSTGNGAINLVSVSGSIGAEEDENGNVTRKDLRIKNNNVTPTATVREVQVVTSNNYGSSGANQTQYMQNGVVSLKAAQTIAAEGMSTLYPSSTAAGTMNVRVDGYDNHTLDNIYLTSHGYLTLLDAKTKDNGTTRSTTVTANKTVDLRSDMELDMLASVKATDVVLSSGGDVVLMRSAGFNSGDNTSIEGTNSVAITSGGKIQQSVTAYDKDNLSNFAGNAVKTANLTATAAQSIDLSSWQNALGNVSLYNSGTGDVTLGNGGNSNMTIKAVTKTNAATTVDNNVAGNVTIHNYDDIPNDTTTDNAVIIDGNVLATGSVSIVNDETDTTASGTKALVSTATSKIEGSAISMLATAGSINSSASLTASTAAVALNADNDIVNNGDVNAQTDITMDAANGSITNNGTLTATQKEVKLTAAQDITNTKSITSGTGTTLTATNGNIDNSGAINANSGIKVEATSGNITNNGAVNAGNALGMSAGKALTNGGTLTAGTEVSLIAKDGLLKNSGAVTANAGKVELISNKNAIENEAKLTAKGNEGSITLNAAGNIKNSTAGSMEASKDVVITAGTDITNEGSFLADSNVSMTATAGSINSSASLTASTAAVALNAHNDIVNSGNVNAQTDITMDAANGSITNNGGLTAAQKEVKLTAAQDITNTKSITSGTSTTLTATNGNIDNSGAINANSGIKVEATSGNITNNGAVNAGNTISMSAGKALTNCGTLTAGTEASLIAKDGLLKNSGAVTANAGKVELISNKNAIENEAKLTAKGDEGSITLNAAGNIKNSTAGSMEASKDVVITAGTDIINEGSFLADSNVSMTATAGSINSSASLTASTAAVALNAHNDIVNNGDVNAQTDITMDAANGSITNNGTLTATQKEVKLTAAQDITNTKGITSGTSTTLTASNGNIDNSGDLNAGTTVGMTAGKGLTNSGALTAGTEVSMIAKDGLLKNSGAVMANAGKVELISSKNGIENKAKLTAKGTNGAIILQAASNVTNSVAGTIDAAKNVTITAGASIVNDGKFTAGTDASLPASQDITNSAAIKAGTSVIMTAGRNLTNNETGSVDAGTTIALKSTGDMTNAAILTALGTDGVITMETNGLLKNSSNGTLQATQSVDLISHSADRDTSPTVDGYALVNKGNITSKDIRIKADNAEQKCSVGNNGTITATGENGIVQIVAGKDVINVATINATDGSVMIDATTGNIVNAGSLADAQGLIGVRGVTLTAGDKIINIDNLTAANGDVILRAGNAIVNSDVNDINDMEKTWTSQTSGKINAGGSVVIETTNSTAAIGIYNSGVITAEGKVPSSALKITNDEGSQVTYDLTTLEKKGSVLFHSTAQIVNKKEITASGVVDLYAKSTVDNSGNLVATNGGVDLDATLKVTNSGTIKAKNSVELTSWKDSIDNQIVSTDGKGIISHEGNVELVAAAVYSQTNNNNFDVVGNVSNTGSIVATKGNVTITTFNGNITNSDTIEANEGYVELSARAIDKYKYQGTQTSRGDVENRTGSTTAPHITSYKGIVIYADDDLLNEGNMTVTGDGLLSDQDAGLTKLGIYVRANGKTDGDGDIYNSGTFEEQGNGNIVMLAEHDIFNGSSNNNSGSMIVEKQGNINLTSNAGVIFNNTSADLLAVNGTVELLAKSTNTEARTISNSGSQDTYRNGSIINYGDTMALNGTINIESQYSDLYNYDDFNTLVSSTDFSSKTNGVGATTYNGVTISTGNVVLKAKNGCVHNTKDIVTQDNATITANSGVKNLAYSVYAKNDIEITTNEDYIINSAELHSSKGDITINAANGTVVNMASGNIIAPEGSVYIHAGATLGNDIYIVDKEGTVKNLPQDIMVNVPNGYMVIAEKELENGQVVTKIYALKIDSLAAQEKDASSLTKIPVGSIADNVEVVRQGDIVNRGDIYAMYAENTRTASTHKQGIMLKTEYGNILNYDDLSNIDNNFNIDADGYVKYGDYITGQWNSETKQFVAGSKDSSGKFVTNASISFESANKYYNNKSMLSEGDLNITVQGDVVVDDYSSYNVVDGNFTVKSNNGSITSNSDIGSKITGNITFTAETGVAVKSKIESNGGAISLTTNSGNVQIGTDSNVTPMLVAKDDIVLQSVSGDVNVNTQNDASTTDKAIITSSVGNIELKTSTGKIVTNSTNITAGNDVKLISKNGNVSNTNYSNITTTNGNIELSGTTGVSNSNSALNSGADVVLNSAGGDMENSNGAIEAAGFVSITASRTVNNGSNSNINAGADVLLSGAGGVSNTASTIVAGNDVKLSSENGSVSNSAGSNITTTNGNIELSGKADVTNTNSALNSGTDVKLTSAGNNVKNKDSAIDAKDAVYMTASGTVENSSNSNINVGTDVLLSGAGGVSNTASTIVAGNDVKLSSENGSVSNTEGSEIYSGKNVTVQAVSYIINDSAITAATGTLFAQASDGIVNNSGYLKSADALTYEGKNGTLSTGTLESVNASVVVASVQGSTYNDTSYTGTYIAKIIATNGLASAGSGAGDVIIGSIAGQEVLLYSEGASANISAPDIKVGSDLIVQGNTAAIGSITRLDGYKDTTLNLDISGTKGGTMAGSVTLTVDDPTRFTNLSVTNAQVTVTDGGTLAIDRLHVAGKGEFNALGYQTSTYGSLAMPDYDASSSVYYDAGKGTASGNYYDFQRLFNLDATNYLKGEDRLKDLTDTANSVGAVTDAQNRIKTGSTRYGSGTFGTANDGWMNLYIDRSNYQRSNGLLLHIAPYYYSASQRMAVDDLSDKLLDTKAVHEYNLHYEDNVSLFHRYDLYELPALEDKVIVSFANPNLSLAELDNSMFEINEEKTEDASKKKQEQN